MDKNLLSKLSDIYQGIPIPVTDKLIKILSDEIPLEDKVRIITFDIGSSASIQTLIRLLKDELIKPEEASLVFDAFRLSTDKQSIDRISLVWSGPNLKGVPLRRTSQVIIEMIDQAQQDIFLSSFSFYKVKHIVDRLVLAIARGVSVSLLLETPQSSHFKIKNDPLLHIDPVLKQKGQIYIWPYKNRVFSDDTKTGSLHAKFVLQDRSRLFISSANLTESAMDRNIELGVIIDDSAAINNFRAHLDNLISENIITLL